MELTDILHELARKGTIDVHDVDWLQAVCNSERPLGSTAVETILAVDMVSRSVCAEWDAFVKSEVLAHVISGDGGISDEHLSWLIGVVSRNGVVNDHEQFELLVQVMEQLDIVPEHLEELVLAQIERAIVHEKGPLAHIKVCGATVVSKQDVELIRRILIGAEGRGIKSVSRQEMAFLFELNEQTRPSGNHPSWQDLLVKAMTNFVLGGNADLAERRSAALAFESSPHLETRINLCIAHLRMVAHMASGLKNRSEFKAVQPKRVPANWIIDRFQKSRTFESDDAAMVDYVTQMAAGNRHSNTSNALTG